MDVQSLYASAAINIGLAIVILTLFSILKKQPTYAPIYYARRLSKKHHIPFDSSFTLRRFLPSVSWISRSFNVSESEILHSTGLDALVVVRLFKFGYFVSFLFFLIWLLVNNSNQINIIKGNRLFPSMLFFWLLIDQFIGCSVMNGYI